MRVCSMRRGQDAQAALPRLFHSRSVPLEIVHSDILTVSHPSLGGSKYILTFVDDHSRKLFVYFLRNKSDVFSKFKEFHVAVERQTSLKLKTLRTDNGGEYVSREFGGYLSSHGIQHQRTVPHTPQQNGIAERVTARSWRLCVLCCLDRSPVVALARGCCDLRLRKESLPAQGSRQRNVPEGVFSGVTPHVTHLRAWGCRAWKYVADDNQRKVKLAPRGLPRIFIGYDINVKAFRLYNPDTRSVELARDVRFFEESFPCINYLTLNLRACLKISTSLSSHKQSAVETTTKISRPLLPPLRQPVPL